MRATKTRSFVLIFLRAVSTGLVSAAIAGALVWPLCTRVLFLLYMDQEGVTDSVQAVWLAPLLFLAPAVAALAGTILGARRRPVRALPFFLALVVVGGLGLLLHLPAEGNRAYSEAFMAVSAVFAALLLPITVAVVVHAVLRRAWETGRARG